MPTTWLITLDSIVSVSFLFIAGHILAHLVEKIPEPTEINKIAIGSLIAVTGMLSLVIGAAIAPLPEERIIGWLIAFHVLNSGRIRKCLSGFTRALRAVAPAALSATIIGIYYLAFFCRQQSRRWIARLSRKNARDAILASSRPD